MFLRVMTCQSNETKSLIGMTEPGHSLAV